MTNLSRHDSVMSYKTMGSTLGIPSSKTYYTTQHFTPPPPPSLHPMDSDNLLPSRLSTSPSDVENITRPSASLRPQTSRTFLLPPPPPTSATSAGTTLWSLSSARARRDQGYITTPSLEFMEDERNETLAKSSSLLGPNVKDPGFLLTSSPLLTAFEGGEISTNFTETSTHFRLSDVSTITKNLSPLTTATASSASSQQIQSQVLVSSLVAAYLIGVVVVSVVANTLVVVVRVCGRRRRLRSSHICTLTLAVSDVAFSLLVHTLTIVAALGVVEPSLLFHSTGCNYYGFCAMFFGTFSMCIHASVSIIRYVNICHPEKVEWLKLKYVYMLIFSSGLYSSMWALGPLFHWGRYETFEFGCTLAFTDPSRSGRSFVTCAFIFVLLLPLVVVVTCYTLIVVQARRYHQEIQRITGERQTTLEDRGCKDGEQRSLLKQVGSLRKTQRSLRLHKKLIRMSMVVACGYIVAWLPYAVVCMWATYGNADTIPTELNVGASLICKSATAYNPFIYYFMSEGFRADLRWLGRRVGIPSTASTLSRQPTESGCSTIKPSICRSSTRSSFKRSRDRTRENSVSQGVTLAGRKDSSCTFVTSGAFETPPTPLSLFSCPETTKEDIPVFVLSSTVPVTYRVGTRRNSHSPLMEDIPSMSLHSFPRTVSEGPAAPSITEEFIQMNPSQKMNVLDKGSGVIRGKYPCRRSVSFSTSLSISQQPCVTLRSPVCASDEEDVEQPLKTHRSLSLYGSCDAKRIKTTQRRKSSKETLCLHTKL